MVYKGNANSPFNRIAIVGNPASGKSTLAEAIGKITRLPVFHLDLYVWKPNWVLSDEEEFNLNHADILSKPQWIIEGYSLIDQTRERFSRAEHIIFLDAPLEICLERAHQRTEDDKIIPNRFLPESCRFETIHEKHLDFIRDFHANIRPNILEILSKEFSHKNQTFLDGRLSTEDLCYCLLRNNMDA